MGLGGWVRVGLGWVRVSLRLVYNRFRVGSGSVRLRRLGRLLWSGFFEERRGLRFDWDGWDGRDGRDALLANNGRKNVGSAEYHILVGRIPHQCRPIALAEFHINHRKGSVSNII